MKSRQKLIDEFYQKYPYGNFLRGQPHARHSIQTVSNFIHFIEEKLEAGEIDEQTANDITLDDDSEVRVKGEQFPEMDQMMRFILLQALEAIDDPSPEQHHDVLEVQQFLDYLNARVAGTLGEQAREMIATNFSYLVELRYLSIHVMAYNGRELIYLERGEETA